MIWDWQKNLCLTFCKCHSPSKLPVYLIYPILLSFPSYVTHWKSEMREELNDFSPFFNRNRTKWTNSCVKYPLAHGSHLCTTNLHYYPRFYQGTSRRDKDPSFLSVGKLITDERQNMTGGTPWLTWDFYF